MHLEGSGSDEQVEVEGVYERIAFVAPHSHAIVVLVSEVRNTQVYDGWRESHLSRAPFGIILAQINIMLLDEFHFFNALAAHRPSITVQILVQ